MRYQLLSAILILWSVLAPPVWAGNTEGSTTTLTIDPSATAGTTITAADENDRSSDASTWANAHLHSLANTTSIGNNAAGNKNLCADAADTTDTCLRFDDTNNIFEINVPAAGTYNQLLTVSNGTSLTNGGLLIGTGPGGVVDDLAVQTNGQLPIGDGTGAPTLATLTAGGGTGITNGAGSITITSGQTFVGSFTRDISAATGSVVYTGVGFQPRAMVFIGNVDTTSGAFWTVTDCTNSGGILDNNQTTTDTYGVGTAVFNVITSAGNQQSATFTTCDTDGFTLGYTKTGTPTGTATVRSLALR